MKKILVIEDDPSIRTLIVKLLTRAGHTSVAAENGAIGLSMARTEEPDLILCDIMMPEMDGYGVLSALQDDPNTSMIPFICLTAHDERSTLRRVMQLGASDFITKPFTKDELLGAIATQLEKQERFKRQQTDAVQAAIQKIYSDPDTDLPNQLILRDNFQKLLKNPLDAGQILAVGVLNLEELDRFNYSLGADFTDSLMREIACRLWDGEDPAATVARLGSEQLAIIFPLVADKKTIEEMVAIILTNLAQPFQVNGYQIFVDCHMGIAIYPDHGGDIDSLLKAAKAATHQAKKQGSHHYQFYTPTLQDNSYDRLMLEMALRQAIEEEQFILNYQPKFDLRSKTIIGAEALVRWLHPEKGMISPNDFIPLAEETGLILPLDELILRKACEQSRIWQSQGFILPIAVNLSGKQFNQPGLNLRVVKVLELTGLDPEGLELELTESAVVQKPQDAIATLKRLKALGVRLSLDDFGTGYSSLGYLQQFPFDVVKIDRCFVRNLSPNSKNVAIIAAIMQLAQSLNLKVVAEGVETEIEKDLLFANHCYLIQGYWFSPPISAEDLELKYKEYNNHVSL
jgi:diguanylate cyclase (GGDEF)-like protein